MKFESKRECLYRPTCVHYIVLEGGKQSVKEK